MNTSSPQPFIKASKDLLGEHGCYWMMAYKPLQDASGFRLWCKAIGMHVSEYDEIAKNLELYQEDEKWGKIIEDSSRFRGVVESVAPSPCSVLLLDKDIREEVGIMKVGDLYCCCLDGYNCDKYKYLKNDFLTVSVWDIINKTCKLANIPIPTIRELEELLDDETYKMYELGLTCTLNQADSDFATPLFKKFKPHSIAETSQMVCMIRPGAKSMLEDFLDRKPYTTQIPELDEILKDSKGRMCYQESVMSFFIWLGVKESESYDLLKKIAKKKFTQEELDKLHVQLKESWIKKVGSLEHFDTMWEIVEANSKYSFNSSHSLSVGLDSLYGAYLKSHYPLEYYTVCLTLYSGDERRTRNLTKELEYFNIKLNPPRFRKSKADYQPSDNSIYKGIASIKYLNETVANELYELKDNQYDTFFDLLIDIDNKTHINSRQLDILINIDFFEEFGKTHKLLHIVNIYNNTLLKQQKSKKNEISFNKTNPPYDKVIIEKYATEQSKQDKYKQYKIQGDNVLAFSKELSDNIEDIETYAIDKCTINLQTTGECHCDYSYYSPTTCIVTNVITKYKNKRITLYNIKSGKIKEIKIGEAFFNQQPIHDWDIIDTYSIITKPKKEQKDVEVLNKKTGEMEIKKKWLPIEGEYEYWCDSYKVLDEEEIEELNREEREYVLSNNLNN